MSDRCFALDEHDARRINLKPQHGVTQYLNESISCDLPTNSPSDNYSNSNCFGNFQRTLTRKESSQYSDLLKNLRGQTFLILYRENEPFQNKSEKKEENVNEDITGRVNLAESTQLPIMMWDQVKNSEDMR